MGLGSDDLLSRASRVSYGSVSSFRHESNGAGDLVQKKGGMWIQPVDATHFRTSRSASSAARPHSKLL